VIVSVLLFLRETPPSPRLEGQSTRLARVDRSSQVTELRPAVVILSTPYPPNDGNRHSRTKGATKGALPSAFRSRAGLSKDRLRQDHPILNQQIRGSPLLVTAG
jgi:hypothetical protein